jgi:hypothetical protein
MTGMASVVAIQNLRRTLRISPSSSASVGIKGSSAMPHFGQWPGPIWRISGCMGQV